MGTSVKGAPPFSPSDVKPQATHTYGSGGANAAPNQGVPATGPILYDLLQRIGKPVANTAALQATVEADRADGQLWVTLDTYTLWVWKDADSTAADATHIEPTDTSAGSGNGRFVAFGTSSGTGQGQVQRVSTDIPLATINAQTSGVAFNVGAALPTNARLVGAEIQVLQVLGGGSSTADTATLQGGTDAAGSIIASTDVHGATGTFSTPGSNPYQTRGGQQLKMTITGDGTHALSVLTTGHLQVDVFYTVDP